MNLDDFSYEENGRRYINPQVALDEENAFIQNLRDTQAQDNAKIYQDTHNLGTDVSSNLGGLNGGEAYFNARYQTPQTNYTIANLKEAAQAKALSDALNNEVAKAKKRYNDAYRAANSGGGSGGGNNGDGDGDDANAPDHENSSDPSQSNPSGVDTIEKRKTNPTGQINKDKAGADAYAGMTGGSNLPSGNYQKKAYLVSPDGKTKLPIGSNKNIYGAVWEAPTSQSGDYISYENQSSFNSMIRKNWVDKGWKVQLGNGRDITGTYNVYFAYFN